MSKIKICVVGSSNMDVTGYVSRLPRAGETLRGTKMHMGYGGKGANQAVMASKLGADVSIVTKLGRDPFGEDIYHNFKAVGVDTSHVLFTEEAYTGMAMIVVDPDGKNTIIVISGANDLLNEAEIEDAREMIASSHVLVCQLEVPLVTTLKALRIAREENVRTILNPAPIEKELPDEIFKLSDVLCPNESEAEQISGFQVQGRKEAKIAGQMFLERGAGHVIITLGENGSLLVNQEGDVYSPAIKVNAVDTTGAGDAFIGSLAFFLAKGKSAVEAMEKANQIAAMSVKTEGTQTSYPSAKDLPPALLS